MLLGLFISTYSQDFIPENVLVYLQYSNNIRDKFLPVWQSTIKKNNVKKETYVSFENNSKTDQIPIPFDSTIFNYDQDGRLISVVSTSPFAGAEGAKRITTTFFYESGLLMGSNDSDGSKMVITRDKSGNISLLEFGENEDQIVYKYNYTSEKLTGLNLLFGEDQSVSILLEDGVFVAKDTTSLMSTIGDKYGRITNVYSHNVGMDNLYDSLERLIEMKIYQGGNTEITSFIYNGDLLQEVGFNNHEGEVGADLKETTITKSVTTLVKYEQN
jgi:hypothetical protein